MQNEHPLDDDFDFLSDSDLSKIGDVEDVSFDEVYARQTDNTSSSASTSGETRSQSEKKNFHERLTEFGAKYKDLFSILSSIIAACAFLSSARYYSESLKNVTLQVEDGRLKDAEARVQAIFRELEATETRYRIQTQVQLSPNRSTTNDGANVDMRVELEIPVISVNGVEVPYFQLPRLRIQETRTRVVQEDGKNIEQQYTVSVPVGLPRVENISPFNCVDCDSSYRQELYLEGVDLERQSTVPLNSRDYIRLARAAVDIGKIDDARRYLGRINSRSQIETLDPLEQAHVLEEVGKTHLLMSDLANGYHELQESRIKYRIATSDTRSIGLHDKLLWEAQFACTEGDSERAGKILRSIATLIDEYDISFSKKNQMIEDRYAICMAIIADYQNSDLIFPVPVEFKIHQYDYGWLSPVELVKTASRDAALPFPMLWDDRTIHVDAVTHGPFESVLEAQ